MSHEMEVPLRPKLAYPNKKKKVSQSSSSVLRLSIIVFGLYVFKEIPLSKTNQFSLTD